MESSCKVTIIVPIYNVEKYLDQCIESIVNQTYKNLEIILVDDGSPDQCPAKCDEWAKKDPRIKVIHKKNGGLSSARNAGIGSLTGKYVCFIDSDDYIEPDMIEKMYFAAAEKDYDICVCNMNYLDEHENKVDCSEYKNISFFDENVIRSFLKGDDYNPISACNKLYKSSLIFKYDICFDESNHWGEDFPFNYFYFKRAKSVISIQDKLYNYLIKREGSITYGITYGKVMRWQNNYRPILELEKENCENYKLALRRHLSLLLCCCRELLGFGDKKLVSECYPFIVDEVQKYYKEFLALDCIPKSLRLSVVAIHFVPRLFKVSYKCYKFLKRFN